MFFREYDRKKKRTFSFSIQKEEEGLEGENQGFQNQRKKEEKSRIRITFAQNTAIMNIKQILQQKQAILIGISILSGLFVTSEEIFDCIELARINGVHPGIASLALLTFQCMFFTLFTWILLRVNVNRQAKGKAHIKQLGYSLLVSILFSLIVWQAISPIIQSRNEEIRQQYEQTNPDERPDRRRYAHKEPGKEKRENHFYGKKLYYLMFHEPQEAWQHNLFTLCIVLFTLTRIYHLYQRKEEVERSLEKLQSESLQSRLDALHNQINPHFFFNALNSLHALIAEDEKQKSLSYLSNLSNVFRYILQSEKKGLVTLQEELRFLEMYRFMLSVKYEEKLRLDIDIAPAYTTFRLPVLSLLPLVENVIKHNEISARNPLTLSIRSTDEPALVIQNEKHPKLDEIDKVGIGLKNLNNRFFLLAHKEIRVEETSESFRIILPLDTPIKSAQS